MNSSASALDVPSIRVLLVDDEQEVRALLRAHLEREGLEVGEAATGAEARHLFDDRPFDVVVTDIFMPGEDGISLIQYLRGRWPKLPVVAITGGRYQELSWLGISSALGAGALLEKPFHSGELVAAIRRVLASAG